MIIGFHHGGVTVVDLDRAVAHLQAITDWHDVHRLEGDHPMIAGLGVSAGALLPGPNAFLEVLAADGDSPTRRTVAEPGVTHHSVQLPDMASKAGQLAAMNVESHAAPVKLGTGFSYLYVRDREHNVVEIEGAAHAPDGVQPWFSHTGIATNDIDQLRSIFEALLDAPALATTRLGSSDALDQVTALRDVEVTMTWIPVANANIELLEFHNPATADPEHRAVGLPGVGHVCFEVDDLSKEAARAVEIGLKSLGEPRVGEGVEVARFADPDGNTIEIVAFEEPDHPLSLRNVDAFDRYRQMDALLAERSAR